MEFNNCFVIHLKHYTALKTQNSLKWVLTLASNNYYVNHNNYYYYSFKMFLRFWLAFNPRLIPADRLAPTKFGKWSYYRQLTSFDLIILHLKLTDRRLVPKDRWRNASAQNRFWIDFTGAKMVSRIQHYDEKLNKLQENRDSKNNKNSEERRAFVI